MVRFPSFSKTPAPTLFIISIGLVCVSVIAVRFFLPQTIRLRITEDEYRLMEQAVEKNRAASLPQLESSKFSNGDALSGIGGNWTFLDQAVLDGSTTKPRFAGTVPQRQTMMKLAEGELKLQVYEAKIVDTIAFQKELLSAEKINIAGREGYLVPDISGGSSLLMKGSDSIVVLTVIPNFDWKNRLPDALSAYIATVSIH
ncbi:hypothetical protein IT408_04890 [Candidatus Uhrbacteria bacterium]|nr:hypothetical protein [Candidatus Uhrbacteria bacterium]